MRRDVVPFVPEPPRDLVPSVERFVDAFPAHVLGVSPDAGVEERVAVLRTYERSALEDRGLRVELTAVEVRCWEEDVESVLAAGAEASAAVASVTRHVVLSRALATAEMARDHFPPDDPFGTEAERACAALRTLTDDHARSFGLYAAQETLEAIDLDLDDGGHP